MEDQERKNEELFEEASEEMEGDSESSRKAGTDDLTTKGQPLLDKTKVGSGSEGGKTITGAPKPNIPGNQNNLQNLPSPVATSTATRGDNGSNSPKQGVSDQDKQAFLEWMNTEGLETFLRARSPSPAPPRARGSFPNKGNVDQPVASGNELSSPELSYNPRGREGYFTPQNLFKDTQRIQERRAETEGKSRKQNISRRLDELLSDTREQVSEDQDLEIRLSGLLDMDLRGVIVNLQGDHGVHTTRSRLRSLLRHGIRAIELGKRVTPGELASV